MRREKYDEACGRGGNVVLFSVFELINVLARSRWFKFVLFQLASAALSCGGRRVEKRGTEAVEGAVDGTSVQEMQHAASWSIIAFVRGDLIGGVMDMGGGKERGAVVEPRREAWRPAETRRTCKGLQRKHVP